MWGREPDQKSIPKEKKRSSPLVTGGKGFARELRKNARKMSEHVEGIKILAKGIKFCAQYERKEGGDLTAR